MTFEGRGVPSKFLSMERIQRLGHYGVYGIAPLESFSPPRTLRSAVLIDMMEIMKLSALHHGIHLTISPIGPRTRSYGVISAEIGTRLATG